MLFYFIEICLLGASSYLLMFFLNTCKNRILKKQNKNPLNNNIYSLCGISALDNIFEFQCDNLANNSVSLKLCNKLQAYIYKLSSIHPKHKALLHKNVLQFSSNVIRNHTKYEHIIYRAPVVPDINHICIYRTTSYPEKIDALDWNLNLNLPYKYWLVQMYTYFHCLRGHVRIRESRLSYELPLS